MSSLRRVADPAWRGPPHLRPGREEDTTAVRRARAAAAPRHICNERALIASLLIGFAEKLGIMW